MNWVPTLADAERWVAEKEAVKAIYACRPLVERMWRRTDEYKVLQKVKQEQARKEKVRKALEREAREKRKAEIENERLAEKAEHEAWEAKQKQYETHSRRSRIDWSELIDNPVTVDRQIQWERATTALAMRNAGLTYREIGDRMGLCNTSADRLVKRARRRKPGAVSPAEAYMNAEYHKEVMDMCPPRKAVKPVQYPGKVERLLLANGG